MLAARNVTVWRLSVCLSRRHTHRDSTGGAMRHGQRTFWPDNNEDRRICFYCIVSCFQYIGLLQRAYLAKVNKYVLQKCPMK